MGHLCDHQLTTSRLALVDLCLDLEAVVGMRHPYPDLGLHQHRQVDSSRQCLNNGHRGGHLVLESVGLVVQVTFVFCLDLVRTDEKAAKQWTDPE
jgi:hypothetical protein